VREVQYAGAGADGRVSDLFELWVFEVRLINPIIHTLVAFGPPCRVTLSKKSIPLLGANRAALKAE
jgi:hypothetical protein